MSTITDGGLLSKDPSDVSVLEFDWDAEHLAAAVTIATSSFTVTSIPSGDTALTVSDTTPLGIQSGSRKTKCKLSGGTLGYKYRVDNTITTSESPSQTKQRSVFVRVEER